MTTLLVSQPNFESHVTPGGHPERPDRLRAIEEALSKPQFDTLLRKQAPSVDLMLAELVHAQGYLEALRHARPAEGIGRIDEDTFISSGSLDAASTALGGGLAALHAVVMGEADNAFCAIRPPGHHAEIDRPMGFCLVNTIAVVAREAQRKYGAERVAIVDFDVHHGNGTQDIFESDATVFYASSHQMPLFPGTGKADETGVGNIVNVPLPPNTGGETMREAYLSHILPALDAFAPDILLISAGFDADHRDPLAQLNWMPDDFAWVTGRLMDVAARRCANRVVSLLEGGYDRHGLAAGVTSHVAMLQNGAASKEDSGG
jgi:acetoin utilization deacetylase AcuC-like enzyme